MEPNISKMAMLSALSLASDATPEDFADFVSSDMLANISTTLQCDPAQICDFAPMKDGLTNLSCCFRVGSQRYVYRQPGIGTEELIDRRAEMNAQLVAKELGLDETFIYENPEKGWKISRYLENCHTLDAHDPKQLEQAMCMARTLHECDASVERSFDFYDEGMRYLRLAEGCGPIDLPGFYTMADKATRLVAFVRADDAPTCLTHNDFFELNLLLDAEGKLYLIDWEYAGMGDYANDFGTFAVCCKLDRAEIESALAYYLGRTPTTVELRHNLALIGLAGWCWTMWSVYKEAQGAHVGEWMFIYMKYAKEYVNEALALYEADGKDA